uniref:CCAAT-binding factor domain-containing protein n=1 Tax=Anguilla anguilla TaxID=7936 RepID=A0A0E9SKF0_ANGAN
MLGVSLDILCWSKTVLILLLYLVKFIAKHPHTYMGINDLQLPTESHLFEEIHK